MSQETTLNGRIVAGHPMSWSPVIDDRTKQPKVKTTGETVHECFFMIAIAKTGEADWKQTAWGQIIASIAIAAYTRGETNRPDFSWKVIDGDSRIPNRNNKIPADREGFPGHWIVTCKTQLRPTPCFHVGKYGPMDQIQDKNEIKCGDYGRVNVQIEANGTSSAPAQTPGVYVNPMGFSLDRAGELIQTEGSFDAAAAFGGAPAAAAPVATPPPAQAVGTTYPASTAVAPPPPAPQAPDFLSGTPAAAPPPPPAPPAEPKYNVGGTVYTKSQLVAAGYTEANFATLTPV